MLKSIITTVCCFVFALSLAACGTGFGTLKYTDASDSEIPSETLIAENSEYKLELNTMNMGFLMTEKASGKQWSTTPISDSEPLVDELGMPIKKHPRVESVLAVECKNFDSNETNTYYSYIDAIGDGQVECKNIKNGILINYYFSEAKIMIPLKCELIKNGIRLSVDPNKIRENKNRVISISVAPFLCGVKNGSEDSYLFVPSGSGAIVGTDEKSDQGDSYSAQIFGYDPAIDEVAEVSKKEGIRLNVFGSKSGNKAVCAIVDGSPGSAWINVTSGSKTTGYSSCYASFQMRGYTNHTAQLFSYEKVENVVYSKKMINKPISVTFYPLSDENADYTGMANLYREYLIKESGRKENKNGVPLNIRILGGTTMIKSFLGIPYNSVYPTSTVSDTQKIISDIKDELKSEFSVQLKGFGENGADEGKIAGNYTVNGNIGSMNEVKKLFGYAKENGIDLYFDFDVERFNKNGAGISKFFDSAANAGEQKIRQYYYDIAVKNKKTETGYNLLSPDKFGKITKKILKKAKTYDFAGVSLDTISSVAYSDYSDKENSKYYSKNGFVNAATDIIKSIKKDKKRFMASSANVYSAVNADIISEAPVSSDKDNIFLYDIPFYQMVFKGFVPITVQSVNLSVDERLTVLKAVESGCGLGYTVISKWDNSVINAEQPYFYNSVFSDVKKSVFDNSRELSDYFKSVSGEHIKSHTVFETGLRETVFENGVCVYVNMTDKEIETPAGNLAAYDYLITEKNL